MSNAGAVGEIRPCEAAVGGKLPLVAGGRGVELAIPRGFGF
jgi:hypothetical protein